jgi:hypothetical protein
MKKVIGIILILIPILTAFTGLFLIGLDTVGLFKTIISFVIIFCFFGMLFCGAYFLVD